MEATREGGGDEEGWDTGLLTTVLVHSDILLHLQFIFFFTGYVQLLAMYIQMYGQRRSRTTTALWINIQPEAKCLSPSP